MTPPSPTEPDAGLLRRHVRRGADADDAFAVVVRRYVSLVYSSALRQLRDPHAAEDVTQKAFMVLARKAGEIDERTVLSAWLLNVTRYLVADARKVEGRRRHHEQKAAAMTPTVREEHPNGSGEWDAIAPDLDDALAELGQANRVALVLRYFEGLSLKEVAARLGISETAAKARVSRAVEQMRGFFARRGVAVSAVALAGLLGTHAVQAAPAGLAAATAGAATAMGIGAGWSVTTKGALGVMAWTKTKVAAASVAALALVGGTTAVVVTEMRSPSGGPTPIRQITPAPTGLGVSADLVSGGSREVKPVFTGRISGTVRSAEGRPLAGVEVALVPAFRGAGEMRVTEDVRSTTRPAGVALEATPTRAFTPLTVTVEGPGNAPSLDVAPGERPVVVDEEKTEADGSVRRTRMAFAVSPRPVGPAQKVTSGADGSFTFDVTGPATVVARTESGYAEVPAQDLKDGGELTLRPYARVEGVLKRDGAPVANQTVKAMRRNGPTQREEAVATTDEQGRFRMHRVPPGTTVFGRSAGGSMPVLAQSTTIDLRPGESHSIVIGGTGATVVGTARLPEARDAAGSTVRDFANLLPAPIDPAVAMPDATRVEAVRSAREAARERTGIERLPIGAGGGVVPRPRPVEMNPDGTFRVEDVEPGTYRLEIHRLLVDAHGRGTSAGRISHVFSVEGGGIKDLGTVSAAPEK